MLENIVMGPIPVVGDESEILGITDHLLSQGYIALFYSKGTDFLDQMGILVPEELKGKIKGSIATIYHRKLYMA